MLENSKINSQILTLSSPLGPLVCPRPSQPTPPEAVTTLIKNASGIVMFVHTNPDGDAHSCSVALGIAASRLGKPHTIITDSPESFYSYIHSIEKLTRLRADELINLSPVNKPLTPGEFGSHPIAVIMDAGGPERVGEVFKSAQSIAEFSPKNRNLVIIDHHAPQKKDETGLSYINPSAKACAQLMLATITQLGVEIDPLLATVLLWGISTDTGHFKFISEYENEVFNDASYLAAHGASTQRIQNEILGNVAKEEIQYLAKILSSITIVKEGLGKWAFAYDDEESYNKLGEYARPYGQLFEQMLRIRGVELVAFFKYTPDGTTSVSLRAGADSKINCAEIASRLGGGGHAKASAFRVDKSFSDAAKLLVKKLKS